MSADASGASASGVESTASGVDSQRRRDRVCQHLTLCAYDQCAMLIAFKWHRKKVLRGPACACIMIIHIILGYSAYKICAIFICQLIGMIVNV